MSEAALKIGTQDIVVEDSLPFAPEAIWRALTTGALMARWDDGADRVRAGRRQSLHLQDYAGGRVGWPHPL